MNCFLITVISYLINGFPHLLAYYPYRDSFRFSTWKIFLCVGFIQLINTIFYGFEISWGPSGHIAEYFFALIYMALYFFFIRADRFKLLFLYLFVADYTIIIRGISAFIYARFLHGAEYFSPLAFIIYFLVTAVTMPFMLRFFCRTREKVFNTDAPSFWRTAWMVPAFITIIVIIFTGGFDLHQAASFDFILARMLLLVCIFVVYSTLIKSLDGIRQQAALSEQAAISEHLLALQKVQNEQLMRHMQDIRAARHDLRQHLKLIHSYLECNDTEALLHYLDAYKADLPADMRSNFCKNFAVNTILTYYAEETRKSGISFDISCPMPEKLPVSEPEICALIGNLLENALDACRLPEAVSPFIRMRGSCEEDRIVITVDNTCTNEPIQENGHFLSSKHEGFGYGLRSVRSAAEKNGGYAEFSYEAGIFMSSVLLYGQSH